MGGQVKITGGSPGTGKVLTSDASGLASWQIPAAGGVTLDYSTTIELGPIKGRGTDQTYNCPSGYVVTGIHGGGDDNLGGEIKYIYIRCTRIQ